MTTYLCTCGTSAFKAHKFNGERLNAAWVRGQGGLDKAIDRIYQSFAPVPFDDETAWSRDLSAELHSLARMGVCAQDRVILYASETLDGQACAYAVKRYLDDKMPGILCRVDVVDGLQVTDAARFRTVGVLDFTRRVLREIDNYGAAGVCLNPTGGFKSLVPYTVLIGMIRRVRARYIFEQSSALIELPAMPVDFAHARLEPILDLLKRIERETDIPVHEWEAALPASSRAELDFLFEREGSRVTLSPVGLLVLEEMDRPQALVPFLSRRALDDLAKLERLPGCNPLGFLERMARDRVSLEGKIHARLAQGFFWLKPGNTPDRYLVSIEKWRLLVWRMVDHDEYETMSGWTEAHGEKERGDRRHLPFVRMDLYRF